MFRVWPAASQRGGRFFFATRRMRGGIRRNMFDLCMVESAARLTLNRPEARNAIPAASWCRLGDAAEEAVRLGARILIVEGSSGVFCAGADVSDFTAMHEDSASRTAFRLAMRDALARLRGVPIPSLAVIDGPCFGAGVALAIACDLRIAGAGARFAVTPAKLGISYPQEDLHRLVALVGEGQAARLLFSASSIDGLEAERIGLVERYAGSGLAEAVASLAGSILANSAESIATLKTGLRLAAGGTQADAGQDRRFDALLGSVELAARLAAMRGGRGVA